MQLRVVASVFVCLYGVSVFFVQTVVSAQTGENTFKQQCAACHTIGGGSSIGPDLKGKLKQRREVWFRAAVRSVRKMRENRDPEMLRLIAEYGVMMPDFEFSDEQLSALVDYIRAQEAELEKKKLSKKAYPDREKVSYDQPIDFSHKLHAGDHKIDCLYCHFGAEKSRHAGIPPANVCLNCHSQIRVDSPEIQKIHQAVGEGKPIVWYKRHFLPDHAYFNHSWHINAEISCQTCHGEIQTMVKPTPIKITMGWCVNCHRQADRRAGVFHQQTTKMDCARCHH